MGVCLLDSQYTRYGNTSFDIKYDMNNVKLRNIRLFDNYEYKVGRIICIDCKTLKYV